MCVCGLSSKLMPCPLAVGLALLSDVPPAGRRFLKVGALVYARFMWNRREQLGLAGGLRIPGWGEVQQFLGSGGAMVFRQVLLTVLLLHLLKLHGSGVKETRERELLLTTRRETSFLL